MQATQRVYDRMIDGIGGLLLTLKRRPVIRYSRTCAQRISDISHPEHC